MTTLDEKFFDFCDISSSYKIGGVNDVYSKEQYYDGKKDELKSIFGSLADYPLIDPDSFGLMPINSLKELFDEYYLKYKVTGSDSSFNKPRFYADFLEKLGINSEIELKVSRITVGLNNNIEQGVNHSGFISLMNDISIIGTDVSFGKSLFSYL